MSDKQLQVYHTYQRFIQTLLTMCGSWYMPTKSGKSSYCWTVCVLLVIILYAILNVHMSYFHRHNLRIMMKCIGITITSFGTILKIGTFLMNRGSLMNYHQTLNAIFEEELVRNEKIRTIMLSSLYKICILAYTYSAILIVVILAYLMPGFISITRDFCHLRSPTTNYNLPISRGYGYFWAVPHNYLYHVHFLFETSGASINCITACSMDSAFGYYIYHFASTMQAMNFRLTNLLPTERFSDVLRACVAKHQRLLPCLDTLQHIYGPIVFWHIVTNAVLLCAMLFDATTFTDFNAISLSVSVMYAVIKLLQTFIYAWYGTVLTNAGEDFRKGIYFGEWPTSELDHHVRTNIILTMMQKPMTINAFFTPVDMIMFTNFVNTTMSYFFLLQSISGE